MNSLNRFKYLLSLVIIVSLVFACGKKESASDKDSKKETTEKTESTEKKETTSSSEEGKLYFCEDYVGGKEINVSEVFTPGWLTVMVDLRPAKKTIGVGKVELRLTKIKDESGEKISERIIDTIPFEVQPDWNYTYFKDTKNLKFSSPGYYKVTLQKVDGTPIVSGEVKVISK
jgi:hypothetical protein